MQAELRHQSAHRARTRDHQAADRVSDVVIENSSTGTMEKMGLGFQQMREINPRIVLASSQLMGASGPWKDWIGFGPNSRTAGAMTWLWNSLRAGCHLVRRDSSRHLAGRMLALEAVATLLARERPQRRRSSRSGTGRSDHRAARRSDSQGVARAGLRLSRRGIRVLAVRLGVCIRVLEASDGARVTIRDDDEWRRLSRRYR